MADNRDFLISQMTKKGKRLSSGLETFVKAVDEGGDVTGFAYHFALGCLGGDFITKKLMKTKWLEKVVSEMLNQKLMKEDRAEKLLTEWNEKFNKEGGGGDAGDVEVKGSEPVAIAPEDLVTPSAAVEDVPDTDGATVSRDNDGDGDIAEEEVAAIPQSENTRYDEMVVEYNVDTGKLEPKFVPSELMTMFYYVCDQFSVRKTLPDRTNAFRGQEWHLVSSVGVGRNRYRATYKPMRYDDFVK